MTKNKNEIMYQMIRNTCDMMELWKNATDEHVIKVGTVYRK